ncbi:MAG: hypothetical protein RSI33_08305, partial [Clostridia bacterium]
VPALKRLFPSEIVRLAPRCFNNQLNQRHDAGFHLSFHKYMRFFGPSRASPSLRCGLDATRQGYGIRTAVRFFGA